VWALYLSSLPPPHVYPISAPLSPSPFTATYCNCNLQDEEEFPCLALNRDVWNDPDVQVRAYLGPYLSLSRPLSRPL